MLHEPAERALDHHHRLTTLNPLSWGGSWVTISTSMPSSAPCSAILTFDPASTHVLVIVGYVVASWPSRSMPITLSLTCCGAGLSAMVVTDQPGELVVQLSEDPFHAPGGEVAADDGIERDSRGAGSAWWAIRPDPLHEVAGFDIRHGRYRHPLPRKLSDAGTPTQVTIRVTRGWSRSIIRCVRADGASSDTPGLIFSSDIGVWSYTRSQAEKAHL